MGLLNVNFTHTHRGDRHSSTSVTHPPLKPKHDIETITCLYLLLHLFIVFYILLSRYKNFIIELVFKYNHHHHHHNTNIRLKEVVDTVGHTDRGYNGQTADELQRVLVKLHSHGTRV